MVLHISLQIIRTANTHPERYTGLAIHENEHDERLQKKVEEIRLLQLRGGRVSSAIKRFANTGVLVVVTVSGV